jgi:hypothetical protein
MERIEDIRRPELRKNNWANVFQQATPQEVGAARSLDSMRARYCGNSSQKGTRVAKHLSDPTISQRRS